MKFKTPNFDSEFYCNLRRSKLTIFSFLCLITSLSIQNALAVYYTPNNVTPFTDTFSFGQNAISGESIQWKQEVVGSPYNNEIQDYVKEQVGLDDNNNLVLRIDRVGPNLYDSSRINTSIYNGIRIGSGEKLSVEFEAQLPMAKDSSGNYVPNVPLWPALWLMGNEKLNNSWVGWPYCAEIDVMEWSPTKPSGYETQANVAYHWNGEDGVGYNHWYTSSYYNNSEIHTKFHKWRVDIYRYDDGINTNKIEIFFNDVYISGSLFTEETYLYNKEFWYPTTNKNGTQLFGAGDKEYFLIMNIAMGGTYPETSYVPSEFDYAEMVVKSVSYEVIPLSRFTLDLNFDSNKISLTKSPNRIDYEYNENVHVEATPASGYVLDTTNIDWSSHTVVMNEDKSYNIYAYPDNNDDDGDGLTNYNEAIVYNSDPNNIDTDNDNLNDYFESIAGTSPTDSSDYFYKEGSINDSGLYGLEFNTVNTREYSISVSSDLINWFIWKTESGSGGTLLNIFDPSVEIDNISGLDFNSDNFFFKVDIEEASTSWPPLPPPTP